MLFGPALGGLLAQPARQFPSTFSSTGLFARSGPQLFAFLAKSEKEYVLSRDPYCQEKLLYICRHAVHTFFSTQCLPLWISLDLTTDRGVRFCSGVLCPLKIAGNVPGNVAGARSACSATWSPRALHLNSRIVRGVETNTLAPLFLTVQRYCDYGELITAWGNQRYFLDGVEGGGVLGLVYVGSASCG